jgi:predicted AAA+ superfamily ATPase
MDRAKYHTEIVLQLSIHPVCALLGARQVGKTTLALQFAKDYVGKVEIFDLEHPVHLASLDNPFLTLSQFADHLIIIDEIQRRPDLFPVLRVLVDDPHKTYRFLILGSASRELIQQSSETLAGRIGYIELPPFTLAEAPDSQKLFIRGGFPRSYLASTNKSSFMWRQSYIQTFLERDLLMMGFEVPPRMMHRLWMMLCSYHGQLFNASSLATSLMISPKTVMKYVDILAGTFMVRILQPWFENITKRQVKTPKIYIRDSGIYHALMGIETAASLAKTPHVGAAWEGFALEAVINLIGARVEECYFWSTHNDAELDLLICMQGKRWGFECKYTDSPKLTKSMHTALADLKLNHLLVIYPGERIFPLTDSITACGIERLTEALKKL